MASSSGSPAGSSATMLRSSLSDLRAAENGGMQRAKPQRRMKRARSTARPARHRRSQRVGQRGATSSRTRMTMGMKGTASATWRASAAAACAVGGIRLGQHDGGRLDLGRGGRRAGPGRLDDRECAGVGEGLRQAAGGLVGDDEDRTLQRHAADAIPGRRKAAIYAAAINAASTAQAAHAARKASAMSGLTPSSVSAARMSSRCRKCRQGDVRPARRAGR